MSTIVYKVRHAESPKEGNERTRGLTEKGQIAAQQLTELLLEEEVDAVISSPYRRSILTVEQLAQQLGQEVLVYEGLKERIFSAQDKRLSDEELLPLLKKSYSNPNYAMEGGESNTDCQTRAEKVLKEILAVFREKKIVISSHGAVMTLMMGFYDAKFGLDFLQSTSKPDIYRMEFNDQELLSVQRLWTEHVEENQ